MRLGIAELLQAVKGLRVGAILNPTSVTPELGHMADVLHEAGVLAALFGPEHGVRGDVQYLEEVPDARDARTGVPAHSLYGRTFDSLTPRDEHLRGLDALVFDVQDVGARYYTYLATMGLALRAAARHKLRFFVLDRPNPIGGVAVEGGTVQPGFESFVGLFRNICARHGLTAGEYARFINEGADLHVVPMIGWRRDMLFDETRLPWVLPSPNMPALDTALLYPGMCLLEGTNLSEGRGTTKPFEIFGAPWLDGEKLAAALRAEQLDGVRFRPCSFTPTWDKHAKKRCHGVQIHLDYARGMDSVRVGVAAVVHARAQDPAQFRWRTEKYEFVEDKPAIDLLAGSNLFRERAEQDASVDQLCALWTHERAQFVKERERALLYE
ncbi:MAG TPA: DUF1343 domain-containing protein [Myxococcales bacterium]|nr:DUF1343 domain-containing protein [Myxococcales bacterium]